jgi:hypothetical protein
MRVSIRLRRTTAKATSWPLISGSSVGKRSNCFVCSLTSYQILVDKKGAAFVAQIVLYRVIVTQHGSHAFARLTNT